MRTDPPAAQEGGGTVKLCVGVPREDVLFSQQLPSPSSSHQKSMPLCRFAPAGVKPIRLAKEWLWLDVS